MRAKTGCLYLVAHIPRAVKARRAPGRAPLTPWRGASALLRSPELWTTRAGSRRPFRRHPGATQQPRRGERQTSSSSALPLGAAWRCGGRNGTHERLSVFFRGLVGRVVTTVDDVGGGVYGVAYASTVSAHAELSVRISDEHLPGSPFYVVLGEPGAAGSSLSVADGGGSGGSEGSEGALAVATTRPPSSRPQQSTARLLQRRPQSPRGGGSPATPRATPSSAAPYRLASPAASMRSAGSPGMRPASPRGRERPATPRPASPGAVLPRTAAVLGSPPSRTPPAQRQDGLLSRTTALLSSTSPPRPRSSPGFSRR